MARKLPSLNALRAFEAAARHGSFSRAADELFVTHAAVSRHIRDLEKWLNRPLFHRLGRGVRLTEAGDTYRRALTPLFDKLATATAEIRQPVRVELTVTVEPTIAARWLVARLWRFQERHPDIELNIQPSEQIVDFRTSAADIGIRFGPGGWDGVDAVELAPTVTFPVCSPDLLEGRPATASMDITRFPLIHEETRQWWREWLQAADLPVETADKGPRFQEAGLALDAAEQGMGFALGDDIVTADALAEGRLVRPFSAVLPGWSYYVVHPAYRAETEAAAAFRRWLVDEAAAMPGLTGP
jgi:LysR family glycine cleavage system transcriptional activator